MGIRNVKIKPIGKMPPFRKVAMGTWAHPGDPQIYGTVEIDLTKAYAWRSKLPADAPKVTVTHMIARAIALSMARYPDLNGFIRFRRVYLRQSVDIAFLVAVKQESGREDLSGMRLEAVDKLGVTEIAAAMAAKVEHLRQKQDTPLQKSAKLMSILPGFLVRFFLWLTALFSYALNIRFPGIPRDPFGGCILTNVGMFGLDVAYAPLVPYSRVPLILLVGEAKKRPVVVGDKVEVREVVKVVREAFDNPDTHFVAGTPGAPGAA
jgi:pyruvate/2-oxoglutarate dehydrogenase complex dihydrolipoamide acyltransferase (E2) component